MKWMAIACGLLVGCAHQQLTAPSGFGVTSGLGQTQAGITDARRYNDVAVVHNQKAMTNVERIDAKAKVLEKYWK
jgi:hypothetical protein